MLRLWRRIRLFRPRRGSMIGSCVAVIIHGYDNILRHLFVHSPLLFGAGANFLVVSGRRVVRVGGGTTAAAVAARHGAAGLVLVRIPAMLRAVGIGVVIRVGAGERVELGVLRGRNRGHGALLADEVAVRMVHAVAVR